jgi:ribosomal peptide maturation radical SAM protein 1
VTAADGILLVCMPFGGVFSPSIGLSLLKAELAGQRMPARVLYFSIRFAELVGQHFYYGLATEARPSIEDLAGEWIFSRAFFGASAENEAYVDEILRKRTTWLTNDCEKPASPALIERILRARREVDGFLDWCRDEILRARPKLVGFSSMFQQRVASLALARLVKQSLPETFVVLGGADCADVMGAETVRQFPFVDAVVSGEADLVFPELARRVLEGRPVSGLPGVRTRDGLPAEIASGRFSDGPMVQDLDALPYPDYSDYFKQFEASRYGPDWQPRIYLETSRGCWWGEKKHCTFCGLNSRSMAFRSKSATRAMDEFVWLTRRHPGCAIHATDNILDMRYLENFVPQLAARRPRVKMFYEVKANLGKEQLRLLRDAGVRHIQPGIESFSDPVLRLMRKGVSGLQNIQLLKWCKELGIEPGWNLIWGFPGEPPDEYARMAELVPLLAHLHPPGGYGVVRLDRFSPNFDDAERLGLVNVRPVPPYRYVYALPGEALARLASFFTFEYREPRDLSGYVTRLEKKLRAWPGLFGKYDLFCVDRGNWLLVWDLRPVSRALLTALHGIDRVLYRACDTACDPRQLAESAALHLKAPVSPEEVTRRLEPLVERGLMVRDASRYLALAIPLGEYSPPARAVERFCALVRALGRRVPGGVVVSPDAAQGPAVLRSRAFEACPRRRGRLCGRRAGRLTASQFSVNARGDVRIRRIPSY